MTVQDYVTLATAGLIAVGALAGILNRWAVANHESRLATITSAAGNAAGRIRLDLQALPLGANIAAETQSLIAVEAPKLADEFAPQLAKIGGDVPKVAGIIAGQLGQLPPVLLQGALAATTTAGVADLAPAAAAAIDTALATSVGAKNTAQ